VTIWLSALLIALVLFSGTFQALLNYNPESNNFRCLTLPKMEHIFFNVVFTLP
jgi:hypothetical protein